MNRVDTPVANRDRRPSWAARFEPLESRLMLSADNFAVLFSGGFDAENNYARYYENTRDLYNVLVDDCSVAPENVWVLFSDGGDPGVDQSVAQGGGTVLQNSDMSFVQGVDRTYSATAANLQAVFSSVAAEADQDDHFLFWTFDHGSGSKDPAISGEEQLVGWNEFIDDDQFAAMLSGVDAGQTSYVFAQCFAGGMLDDLQPLPAGHFGMAATNHYEESYGDGFSRAFIDGLEAGHRNTHDLYQYALANDPYAQPGGQFQEHPWMTGDDFSIFYQSDADVAVTDFSLTTADPQPGGEAAFEATFANNGTDTDNIVAHWILYDPSGAEFDRVTRTYPGLAAGADTGAQSETFTLGAAEGTWRAAVRLERSGDTQPSDNKQALFFQVGDAEDGQGFAGDIYDYFDAGYYAEIPYGPDIYTVTLEGTNTDTWPYEATVTVEKNDTLLAEDQVLDENQVASYDGGILVVSPTFVRLVAGANIYIGTADTTMTVTPTTATAAPGDWAAFHWDGPDEAWFYQVDPGYGPDGPEVLTWPHLVTPAPTNDEVDLEFQLPTDASGAYDFWVSMEDFYTGIDYLQRLTIETGAAHDVAVTAIDPTGGATVPAGSAVNIEATLTAAGGYTEQSYVTLTIEGPGGYSYWDMAFVEFAGTETIDFADWNTSGLSAGQYTVTVAADTWSDADPNNDALASTVTLGAAQTLTLDASSISDSVTLGDPVEIVATVTDGGAPVTDATVEADLLAPDGSFWTVAMAWDAADSRYEGGFETWMTGDHFLTVYASGAGYAQAMQALPAVTVTGAADDAYEENDTAETAYDLSAAHGAWLSEGAGEGVQVDDDWFTFAVPADATELTVDCAFSHAADDIDIMLYDDTGALVGSSLGTFDTERIQIAVTGGETYDLEVYGEDTAAAYDLRWQTDATQEVLLGDFDGNGAVNGLDIPDFKSALSDPDAWAAENPALPHPDLLGDFDGNGAFNGLDIPGFKGALAGGAVAASAPLNPADNGLPSPPAVTAHPIAPAGTNLRDRLRAEAAWQGLRRRISMNDILRAAKARGRTIDEGTPFEPDAPIAIGTGPAEVLKVLAGNSSVTR